MDDGRRTGNCAQFRRYPTTGIFSLAGDRPAGNRTRRNHRIQFRRGSDPHELPVPHHGLALSRTHRRRNIRPTLRRRHRANRPQFPTHTFPLPHTRRAAAIRSSALSGNCMVRQRDLIQIYGADGARSARRPAHRPTFIFGDGSRSDAARSVIVSGRSGAEPPSEHRIRRMLRHPARTLHRHTPQDALFLSNRGIHRRVFIRISCLDKTANNHPDSERACVLLAIFLYLSELCVYLHSPNGL